MTRSEAVEFFGSVQIVAQLLGISVAAVRQWPDGRVPLLRQHRLAELSGGALRVDQGSAVTPLIAFHGGSSPMHSGIDQAASDLVAALLRFHRLLNESLQLVHGNQKQVVEKESTA